MNWTPHMNQGRFEEDCFSPGCTDACWASVVDAPLLGGAIALVLENTPLGVAVAAAGNVLVKGVDNPRFHPATRVPLARFRRGPRPSSPFVVEDAEAPRVDADRFRVVGILPRQPLGAVRKVLTGMLSDPRVFEAQEWVNPLDIFRFLSKPAEEAVTSFPLPCEDITEGVLEVRLGLPVASERFVRTRDVVVEVLLKTGPRGVVLSGPAGVGKSVFLMYLAHRIVLGLVPAALRGTRIVRIEPSVFEPSQSPEIQMQKHEFLRKLVVADVILVIDEAHRLQYSHNSMSVALDLLKLFVSEHGASVVLITNEEHRLIGKDDALARRFEVVAMEEADYDEVVDQILPAKAKDARAAFGLEGLGRESLEAAFLYSDALGAHAQPHAAVALLDRGVARARRLGLDVVGPELIAEVGMEMLGREPRLGLDPREWEKEIREDLVGHVEEIRRVIFSLVAHERRRLTPQNRKRARAIPFSIVLHGPAGVGKSQLAESICRLRAGRGSQEPFVIRCAEFPDFAYLTQLLGAAAMYVGHGSQGSIIRWLKRNPHGVLEIAEPELGCPELLDRVVMPILGEGFLTGNEGDRLPTRSLVVIITTNVGWTADGRSGPLGFVRGKDGRSGVQREQAREALLKLFPSAVLSRLGGQRRVVTFGPLDRSEFMEIARRRIAGLEQSLGIEVRVDEQMLGHLVDGTADIDQLGVRALLQVIREELEEPLEELMLTEESMKAVSASRDPDGGTIRLTPVTTEQENR